MTKATGLWCALTPEKRLEIAKRLQEKKNGELAGIPVVSRTGKPFPLSYAQQRLWFVQKLQPLNPQFNIPAAAQIRGPLNSDLLEEALNRIVHRHDSLRTTFHEVEGEPLQTVASAGGHRLQRINFESLPHNVAETEFRDLMRDEATKPFDLTVGPLFRAVLIRRNAEDHVLLLTVHHIVSDSWSAGIMVREIVGLYEDLAGGGAGRLSGLPVQYVDFAQWQRQRLAGDAFEEDLAYWKEQLGSEPPAIELASDRPRPAVSSFRGAIETLELPAALTCKLKELSQSENATLFMTLLAAFNVLLYRYTRQEDIVVGCPISGRNQTEIAGLIGFFVNTLALRTDLSGEPEFRELLRRVRAAALGAYAHQQVPFDKVVDAVQPKRDLSHAPLCQIVFGLRENPVKQYSMGATTFQLLGTHNGTSKFDLTLEAIQSDAGVVLSAEYSTDLFDAPTIRRMLHHYLVLLEAAADKPSTRISQLPLLNAEEQYRAIVEWNRTAAPYPDHLCAHQLIEQQAARTPDAVAAVFEGQELTYSELNRKANQLAHHLRRLGAHPESRVALCMTRSLEMIVGVLGIWKAGAAYVPMDPAYPRERLEFLLEDSGAEIVLTQEALAATLPAGAAKVVPLDTLWTTLEHECSCSSVVGPAPDNLAYVIYTSGSTGKPKGVLIPHQGLVNYLVWCVDEYRIESGIGAPVQSSISFDLTITSMFAPLIKGGAVHLLSEEQGVGQLSAALRNTRGFSLVKITPAHLEMLSYEIPPEEAAGKTHAFIIGGENLLAGNIAFWQEYAPDTALINEYGPTETVVGCCIYQVPREGSPSEVVPIGRPIANTQIYLLDDQLQVTPIEVAGELYIGGAGVARGYLNRPDLTAEKFIPDPFSQEPGKRLYRTGDLARYRANGEIECLGRIDHQVKIRGFRVEPDEIEVKLGRHPAIGEAAVIARQDTPGDTRLVAYLVARSNPVPTTEELRRYLKAYLPNYMIPSAFLFLSQLPLTSNGKLDRVALPAPTPEGSQPADFTGPRDELERSMTAIWEEVLNCGGIGIHSDFFELGGHSLLAARVVSRVRKAFGVDLDLISLFESPTIAALSDVVRKAQAAPTETAIPTIKPGARKIQRVMVSQRGELTIATGEHHEHHVGA
jgi:amino acid adenylation domain-containing protein